jgi:glucose-1-phosphate adenylyltransferase
MRLGEFWYRGTADAVYQNLNLVRDARAGPRRVFGGDHVYKFAVDQMDEFHRDHAPTSRSPRSRCRAPRPTSSAASQVDDLNRITAFVEKPANPPAMPGRPDWSLVSMGNYVFRATS